MCCIYKDASLCAGQFHSEGSGQCVYLLLRTHSQLLSVTLRCDRDYLTLKKIKEIEKDLTSNLEILTVQVAVKNGH